MGRWAGGWEEDYGDLDMPRQAPAGPTSALLGFIAGSRGPLGKCILAGADLRVS